MTLQFQLLYTSLFCKLAAYKLSCDHFTVCYSINWYILDLCVFVFGKLVLNV